MTILFVAPSIFSTGEAMTALNSAERLRAVGHSVHFLTSPFIADRLPDDIPVTRLTTDRATNIALWYSTIATERPNVIIFADFEYNFFHHEPYAFGDAAWLAALDGIDVELMTFDHLGITQHARVLSYGRAPRRLTEIIPPLPRHMRRLLPCPIHEPGDVDGRKGEPFEYWDAFDYVADDVIETRKAFVGADGGLLVAHFVPAWTERIARILEYPYYETLSAFFQRAFIDLGKHVTVVSVNESGLLSPSLMKDVSVFNLCAPNYAFIERLIHASDLVLSENAISVTVGKAVCAEIPAAILRADNFDVFPVWDAAAVEQLGTFYQNTYRDAIDMLDVDEDGTPVTIERLRALLTNDVEREAMMCRQSLYANDVAELPWIEDLL